MAEMLLALFVSRLSMEATMKLLEGAANAATILLAGVVVVVLLQGGRVGAEPQNESPVSQPELVGITVPELTHSPGGDSLETLFLSGRPTILYVFATTCRFCDAQKSMIAGFLQDLPGFRVITASREPLDAIRGYWGAGDLPVFSVSAPSFALLRGAAVPMVYVLDSSATVRAAYLGTMISWTPEQFKSTVERALVDR